MVTVKYAEEVPLGDG